MRFFVQRHGPRPLGHVREMTRRRRTRQRPGVFATRGRRQAAQAASTLPLGHHEGVGLVSLAYLLGLMLLAQIFHVAFFGIDVVHAPPAAEFGPVARGLPDAVSPGMSTGRRKGRGWHA